ncbi:UNVERIFIED_CONTAM: hypothetical protein Slati_3106800 [Sesamum latifolium]|uniref:DUF4283 domain-containing protein n=1 Tax=Sesamum latifolium TaxID=2727402 RepID=A0AAW2UVQ7_9LAMI
METLAVALTLENPSMGTVAGRDETQWVSMPSKAGASSTSNIQGYSNNPPTIDEVADNPGEVTVNSRGLQVAKNPNNDQVVSVTATTSCGSQVAGVHSSEQVNLLGNPHVVSAIAANSHGSQVAGGSEQANASAAKPVEHVASGIFIGNVPLATSVNSIYKIADALYNSSHKTLSFVPPSLQNGEVVVRPSLNMIRDGSRKMEYNCCWAAMEEVIEGGPWLFQGQPIVLQKWESGMVLRKLKHTQVLIWIKPRHLSMELWTNDGLSIVASGIGRPLYPDAITRACTRLDFARVCIMLDISSKLPKHVVIMIPKEDGSETACKVDVEYEWLPPMCKMIAKI